jgi:hypothetical protein
VCLFKIDDHCGRRGDTAQALDRWQQVASSKALCISSGDATRIVLPHPHGIKIARNLPAFFVVIDFAIILWSIQSKLSYHIVLIFVCF